MKTTTKNILIIEDDYGNRFVLEKFLGHFFDVSSSDNGKEALTIIKNKIPDLIITDLDMPVINGVQFLKNLRSSLLLREVPIIVVSGHDNTEMKRICDEYKVVSYFVKPFNPVDLVLKIYDHFNISVQSNKLLERLQQTN